MFHNRFPPVYALTARRSAKSIRKISQIAWRRTLSKPQFLRALQQQSEQKLKLTLFFFVFRDPPMDTN
jgi:hypothetical protein